MSILIQAPNFNNEHTVQTWVCKCFRKIALHGKSKIRVVGPEAYLYKIN